VNNPPPGFKAVAAAEPTPEMAAARNPAPAAEAMPTAPIGQWCAEHDERNSFIFPYIALSVILSVVAGLFWLILLVAVHFGLELYRNRRLSPRSRLAHATFGIKLDMALVVMALALTLYMDLVVAALGLRALPRAGAAASRIAGRMPSMRRILRAALMLTDEVVRVAAYLTAARGIAGQVGPVPVILPHSPWTERWSAGTRLTVGLGGLAFMLLVAAPWLTGIGLDGTWDILIHELNPFAR
jgi:hypothetical protein